MSKTFRYQTLTVSSWSGTTYWHKSKPTLDEAYKHIDRYCNRACEILIYRYEVEYSDLKKEDWKATSKIELHDMFKNYDPATVTLLDED
jgi:hypothetical protein|tara:strand:- start:115 stop:381 length:267 start_codon:yes stop_codon:yes gene_type:complete